MPDYRRAWQAGGTYFFTVNLLQRTGNDLLTRQVALLREVVRAVRNVYAVGGSGGCMGMIKNLTGSTSMT